MAAPTVVLRRWSRGLFMPYIGGLPRYTETIDGVAADGYRGFTLTPATAPEPEPSASPT